MSSMLANVMQNEVESILSWIDDSENDGCVQLQSFSWKHFTFQYKGDHGVAVTDHENAHKHEQMFESWEQALYEVKDRIVYNTLQKLK